jgi:hypothetical protein
MGSFSNANGYPENAIKIGRAINHLFGSSTALNYASFGGSHNFYNGTSTGTAGSCGLTINSSAAANAYIDFNGISSTGADIFWSPSTSTFYLNNRVSNTKINASGGTVTAPTPEASDNSTFVATTAYVRSQNQVIFVTTTPHSLTAFNCFVELNSGSSSLTLPLASTEGQHGCYIDLWNNSGSTVTINTTGPNFLGPGGGSPSFTMTTNTTAYIRTDGFNWIILR